MAKRPKPVHQMSNAQFEARFTDEEACKAYLVARRWPNGVACPRCGSVRTGELSRFGSTPCKAQYRCEDCLEPFDYFKPH